MFSEEHPDAERFCPSCSRTLVPKGRFCAFCGAAVGDPDDAIDRYLTQRIEAELAARLKDQPGIVREVADSAESVVTKRFRNYALIIAGFSAILGFIGVRSLWDLFGKFQPLLEQAESRIAKINNDISVTEKGIATVRSVLDKVSVTATDQAQRVDIRAGEINKKLKDLDAVFKTSDQLIANYRIKLQDISSKIDQMEGSLTRRVQQVSQQVLDVSISQAYPMLGQKTYLTLRGQPWGGKESKKDDEIWVNITVYYLAMAEFTQDEVRKLSEMLKGRGYTPVVGSVGTGGPIGLADQIPSTATTSTVFYFSDEKRQLAEEVAIVAHDALGIQFEVKKALSAKGYGLPPISDEQQFIFDHSGLDAEVVLAPPRQ